MTTPPNEILEKKTMNLIGEQSTTEEQLQRIAEEIDLTNQEDAILQSVETSLNAKAPKERLLAQQNLNRLRSIVEAKKQAQNEREQLQKDIDEKKQAPASAAEEKIYDPRTWSPETKETAKNVGKFALVGAAVAGGLWLLSKLWSGTKAAGEKVKEGGSWLWKTVKWLTVGAVLTGLGYGLWKLAEKYRDIQAATKKIAELQDELLKTTDEIKRKAIEKQIEELEKLKAWYESKGKTAAPAAAQADQSAENAAVNAESQAEVAEIPSALAPLAHAIASVSGNDVDWERPISPSAKAVKIGSVLTTMTSPAHPILMKEIFACAENGQVSQSALDRIYAMPATITAEHEKIWHRRAAELVVRFCMKERSQMESLYASPERQGTAQKPLEELTLEEYLEQAGGAYRVLGTMTEQLQKKGRNFLDDESWKQVEDQFASVKDARVKEALREILTTAPPVNGLDKLELTSIFAAASTFGNANVDSFVDSRKDQIGRIVEGETPENAGMTPEEIALFAICRTMQPDPSDPSKNDDAPDLLPFFHELFPDEAYTGDEGKDRTTVNRYITQNMPIAQVVRFALYDRMMRKGHAAGAILTQMDVLRFIRKQNPDLLVESDYQSLMRLGGKLKNQSYREILAACKSIPPDKIDTMLAEVNSYMNLAGETLVVSIAGAVAGAARELGEAGQAAASETGNWAWNNPEYSIPAAGVAGLYATGAGMRLYETYTTPSHFAEILKDAGKATLRGSLSRSKAIMNARIEAGGIIEELNKALVNVGKTGANSLTEGQEALRRFILSKRSAADLAQLRKEITALSGNHAVAFAKIKELAKRPDLLRVVQKFRLPQRIAAIATRPATIAIEVGKTTLMPVTALAKSIHWGPVLSKLKAAPADVLRIIQAMKMPQWMIDAFSSSRTGMEMLVRAALSKGTAGVQYLIKLATVGKNLAKIGGAATLGIDALICTVELIANRARIAGTDNEALKDLYASQDGLSVVQGATGTFFAGSLYAGATGTAFTVALPLVVAAGGAKAYHKQVEKAAEGWLRNHKDWATLSEAELFQKLAEIQPGMTSFGQNVGSSSSFGYQNAGERQASLELREGANEGQRSEIIRGYLMRTTRLAPLPNETEEQYGKRWQQAVQDQYAYIVRHATRGGGDTLNPDIFRRAELYAELAAKSREIDQCGESMKINLAEEHEPVQLFDLAEFHKIPPAQRDQMGLRGRVLNQYREQVEQPKKVLMINAAFEYQDPGVAALIVQQFLSEITHNLARTDGKIRSANYPGIGDGYERDLARYTAFQKVKDAIDTYVAGAIEQGSMTVEEYQLAIQKITVAVSEQPLVYFEEGKDRGFDISGYRNREDLLTLEVLYRELLG